MKKYIYFATIALCGNFAFAQQNQCADAAIQAASARFHISADLDQDATQPTNDGTYQLLIFKNECWYDVSVQMKRTSEQNCEAIKPPVLDSSSANCN